MKERLIVMLDGNLADVLLEDDILRNGLRDLVEIGAASVFVTHIAIDEVMRTPDQEKRERLVHALFWVGARTVPTTAFIPGGSRLDLAALGEDGDTSVSDFSEGNDHLVNDALIAATANDYKMSLATAERRRGRFIRHLPELEVLSVEQLRAAVNSRLVADGRLDATQLPVVQSIQHRLGT